MSNPTENHLLDQRVPLPKATRICLLLHAGVDLLCMNKPTLPAVVPGWPTFTLFLLNGC